MSEIDDWEDPFSPEERAQWDRDTEFFRDLGDDLSRLADDLDVKSLKVNQLANSLEANYKTVKRLLRELKVALKKLTRLSNTYFPTYGNPSTFLEYSVLDCLNNLTQLADYVKCVHMVSSRQSVRELPWEAKEVCNLAAKWLNRWNIWGRSFRVFPYS